MKIAIVLLDYLRHDFTEQTKQSFEKGGYPYDLFVVDKFGVSAAINEGLDKTREYDAVVVAGNDILLPEGWLKRMVEYATAIPESGIIAIYTVMNLPPCTYVNGLPLHEHWEVFGTSMITRKAIDAVGYFNELVDPYGGNDTDYCYRTSKSGFMNYYIHGLNGIHIGNDCGNDTAYRKMKDESLAKCFSIIKDCFAKYDENNDYTIFQKQQPHE